MNNSTRLLHSRPRPSHHHVQRRRVNLFLGRRAICMAIRLDDESIPMEVHGCVAAIARLRWYAAADGHGARIASGRLVGILRQELR